MSEVSYIVPKKKERKKGNSQLIIELFVLSVELWREKKRERNVCVSDAFLQFFLLINATDLQKFCLFSYPSSPIPPNPLLPVMLTFFCLALASPQCNENHAFIRILLIPLRYWNFFFVKILPAFPLQPQN